MTDQRPTCADCRWWLKSDSRHAAQNIGECRRYPPIRASGPGGFPIIHATMWCGEYQP